MDGDIKQAHRCGWVGAVALLPADTTDAQAQDLVAALVGEQPSQRQCASRLKGIGANTSVGEIVSFEVQPGHRIFAQVSSAMTCGLGPNMAPDFAALQGRSQGRSAACTSPIPGNRAAEYALH